MRNVLTKVIGLIEDVEVSAHERVLTDGEMLLLCSDGLHALLDAESIRQILTEHPIVHAVDRLVERALDRGGNDNITAVLVRYSASATDEVGTRP
jgi:serine/threonine protein phosphatase PrpC